MQGSPPTVNNKSVAEVAAHGQARLGTQLSKLAQTYLALLDVGELPWKAELQTRRRHGEAADTSPGTRDPLVASLDVRLRPPLSVPVTVPLVSRRRNL